VNAMRRYYETCHLGANKSTGVSSETRRTANILVTGRRSKAAVLSHGELQRLTLYTCIYVVILLLQASYVFTATSCYYCLSYATTEQTQTNWLRNVMGCSLILIWPRERTLFATQIVTKKTSNGTKVYMCGRLPERA